MMLVTYGFHCNMQIFFFLEKLFLLQLGKYLYQENTFLDGWKKQQQIIFVTHFSEM